MRLQGDCDTDVFPIAAVLMKDIQWPVAAACRGYLQYFEGLNQTYLHVQYALFIGFSANPVLALYCLLFRFLFCCVC